MNDIERYSSKDCIIINNLPLVHVTDYWEDVLTFFSNYLNIKVERDSIVACHPLGPIHNPSQPPAFIVKFVYFDVKENMGKKTFPEKSANPTNAKPIFLNERLTKRDADLMDYLKGLGLKTYNRSTTAHKFLLKSIEVSRNPTTLLTWRMQIQYSRKAPLYLILKTKKRCNQHLEQHYSILLKQDKNKLMEKKKQTNEE